MDSLLFHISFSLKNQLLARFVIAHFLCLVSASRLNHHLTQRHNRSPECEAKTEHCSHCKCPSFHTVLVTRHRATLHSVLKSPPTVTHEIISPNFTAGLSSSRGDVYQCWQYRIDSTIPRQTLFYVSISNSKSEPYYVVCRNAMKYEANVEYEASSKTPSCTTQNSADIF